MSSLRGSLAFPFDQMVKDTINTHGRAWAGRYYRVKHGLSATEFRIFSGI